mgnify:CR=1 FL=1
MIQCKDCDKIISIHNFYQSKKCWQCYCLLNRGITHSNYKHGLSNSKFYRVYTSIKSRCNNLKDIEYHRYGGRGIKYIWKSFEEFTNDMHKSYLAHVEKFGEKQTQIDRIDNNGNYCKENCRWATRKEQARNASFNHFLTFNNKILCLKDWAIKQQLNPNTLLSRIRRNWSIEKALTTPIKK